MDLFFLLQFLIWRRFVSSVPCSAAFDAVLVRVRRSHILDAIALLAPRGPIRSNGKIAPFLLQQQRPREQQST